MFRTESVRNLALLRPRRDQSEIEVEETDSLLENENIGVKRIPELVVYMIKEAATKLILRRLSPKKLGRK